MAVLFDQLKVAVQERYRCGAATYNRNRSFHFDLTISGYIVAPYLYYQERRVPSAPEIGAVPE
jgi:hypothetical protein